MKKVPADCKSAGNEEHSHAQKIAKKCFNNKKVFAPSYIYVFIYRVVNVERYIHFV